MGSWASAASRTILAAALAAGLGGCSLLRQDGLDDAARPYDVAIANRAWEAPPYVRVEGNPMPDGAWARERASECETWQLGDNGCGRAADAARGGRRHASAQARRHVGRPHARRPRCRCAGRPAFGS